jgi:hypothetical protein
MKSNYLFPNQFKKIGWIVLIIGLALGVLFLISPTDINFFNIKVFAIAGQPIFGKSAIFSIYKNNILNELVGLFIMTGLLFIAFSKEKSEDEFISKIRLESLVWATYVNYVVLGLALLFIYDLKFLWVFVFNMFTILIFFIIHFNWSLYKSKKQLKDEE